MQEAKLWTTFTQCIDTKDTWMQLLAESLHSLLMKLTGRLVSALSRVLTSLTFSTTPRSQSMLAAVPLRSYSTPLAGHMALTKLLISVELLLSGLSSQWEQIQSKQIEKISCQFLRSNTALMFHRANTRPTVLDSIKSRKRLYLALLSTREGILKSRMRGHSC